MAYRITQADDGIEEARVKRWGGYWKARKKERLVPEQLLVEA